MKGILEWTKIKTSDKRGLYHGLMENNLYSESFRRVLSFIMKIGPNMVKWLIIFYKADGIFLVTRRRKCIEVTCHETNSIKICYFYIGRWHKYDFMANTKWEFISLLCVCVCVKRRVLIFLVFCFFFFSILLNCLWVAKLLPTPDEWVQLILDIKFKSFKRLC